MDSSSLVISIFIGIGLSAASGFRIFIPPLLIGLLSKADLVSLGASWVWLSENWIITAFAVAALLEVSAYFLPWIDNLFDLITTPLAIIAGTILTAAFLDGLNPGLQWALSIISGVTLSGSVQVSSVLLRGLSTAATGGVGNPIIAIAEDITSILLTLTAVFFPSIAVIFIVLTLVIGREMLIKSRKKKKQYMNN